MHLKDKTTGRFVRSHDLQPIQCIGCEAWFTPKRYRSRGYKVCSVKCKGLYLSRLQDKKVGKECEQCKEIFQVHFYRAEDARFCRHECYAKSLVGIGGEGHQNWKGGLSDCRKCGKKMSIRKTKDSLCRICFIKENLSGEGNRSWKGGITPVNVKIRHSEEYIAWRKSVFERDKYTCTNCGVTGVRLNADHIKPFAYFPELRFDINNGRTLCVPCHKGTPTYGKRLNREMALQMFSN